VYRSTGTDRSVPGTGKKTPGYRYCRSSASVHSKLAGTAQAVRPKHSGAITSLIKAPPRAQAARLSSKKHTVQYGTGTLSWLPPVSFYRYRYCTGASRVCPGSPRRLFTGTLPHKIDLISKTRLCEAAASQNPARRRSVCVVAAPWWFRRAHGSHRAATIGGEARSTGPRAAAVGYSFQWCVPLSSAWISSIEGCRTRIWGA
jgi:hypothetical protein